MKGQKTGGRTVGTPNKVTKTLRERLEGLAGDECAYAKRLHDLTQSTDEHVALKALALVLAYRYGKPPDIVELAGRHGGPVQVTFVGLDGKPLT
jgi:hypothetical protein